MKVRKVRAEMKDLKEIVEATIASEQLEEAWLEAIRRDEPLPSDLKSSISHDEALEFLK